MIDRIGNAAGVIWKFLEQQDEPVSLSTLQKGVDLSSTLAMMGIGWLAREGKLKIEIPDEIPESIHKKLMDRN